VGEDGFLCDRSRLWYSNIEMSFFNIKCRASVLKLKCAVIVATVRAADARWWSAVLVGQAVEQEYVEEDVALVTAGCVNLVQQNANKFGVNVVVAVNQFKHDTMAEIDAIKSCHGCGSYADGAFNHLGQGRCRSRGFGGCGGPCVQRQ
jgi:formyltetrahydrofolate synthetase